MKLLRVIAMLLQKMTSSVMHTTTSPTVRTQHSSSKALHNNSITTTTLISYVVYAVLDIYGLWFITALYILFLLDSNGSLADVALQLQEMFEEAVAEYLKTISLNDQHQLAYYNLGYIYFNNLKRSQEGVKMLKKCLEIDPTDVDAQINMALAFNDLGMIDDVIKSYKYIIQHNDKSVMAHFNLGMCDWMLVQILYLIL